MHISFNVAIQLEAALRVAAQSAGLDAAAFAPEVRTADPLRADYQANGVLAYAKQAKSNPTGVGRQAGCGIETG